MPKNESSTKKPPWIDPDDGPKWTKAVFDDAEIGHGDTLIREATGTFTKRGRPKLDKPKVHVNLRLDSEIVERFRQSGPGWQSRINEILKKAMAV